MTLNRDIALQTVTQTANRTKPIASGVTVVVFRPLLSLEGVGETLRDWAVAHSYHWSTISAVKVSVFERDFETIGFVMLARKGDLPADLQVEEIGAAAASCAAQLFADKVVDLFKGEDSEGISDAAMVMIVRQGRSAIQAANGIRTSVINQIRCGRDGISIKPVHAKVLCDVPVSYCEIFRVTREA